MRTAGRLFTDEEVRKLLTGPASPSMHDLMMIAALTGARLEAIVDLRARDCEAGLFTFKPQEKSARGLPIHSALVDLVSRRTKGKRRADDLFPSIPSPSGPRRNANGPSAHPTSSPNIAAQWAWRKWFRAAGARWSTSIRSGATSSPRPSRRTRWSTLSPWSWAISARDDLGAVFRRTAA